MRVLLVSPYLPRPGIGHGGGMALTGLVERLSQHCELTLVAFTRTGEQDAVDPWRAQCAAVHAVPFVSDRDVDLTGRLRLLGSRLWAAGASLVGSLPYFVQKYQQPAMSRCLRELAAQPFELVGFEFLQMAPYARLFAHHPARLQLNTHEVNTIKVFGAQRLARRPERQLAEGLRALRWARYESTVVHDFDRVMCFTAQDRAVLTAFSGCPHVTVVPLGIDLAALPVRDPAQERDGSLLFVGSFAHEPNVDAALYLLDELFPALQARRPDVRLSLVGREPPAKVQQAALRCGAAVHLAGFVPDLGPLFDQHALFVAPMRYGGGIKTKTLEAMARAMPVVTTTWGADGIPIEDSVHGRVANGDALVDALLDSLAAREARHTMGRNARVLIEAQQSVDAAAHAWLAGAEVPKRVGS